MITVLNPGLFTTVQDYGRWGYQAFGMPVAGAMDRYAFRLANILAGNADNAAVLEMTLRGGSFRFEQDCLVAVCGADMQGMLNGQKIRNWSSFWVPAGSELTFDYAVTGCRAYLAVHGGIDIPIVLGSRSTYTRAGVGGYQGRQLQTGDQLPVGCEGKYLAVPRHLPEQFIPQYGNHVQLRVLLGPQDDLFTTKGIDTLFTAVYTISSEADRMGYRLEGEKIEHSGKPDIVSDALCLGAIQVPGHGMPIVMMADRQTTGGYAKIGTVIGPDLPKLAQAKPGDTVSFVRCTDEEAVAALRVEQQTYAQIQAIWAADYASRPTRVFNVKIGEQTYRVEITEV
ncbi:urea amidolyase related protein [Thermosinus carboxydivorans Nor1]|uniref:Urea amidolyase related protein n=1 Tax=Thermosinus carboxydivorans Nor1 TaxID=401526 RepID=A1HPE1_9FIRM|nr:biotin-dependent carboxyltransferase family protein [Thermosinus carboxydivorans]EAX48247.1 urea amidolyase related protein [Thermosinus carboxydivorans Nor1]